MKKITYCFFILVLNFLLFLFPFNFVRIILLRSAGTRISFSSYIARGIKVDFPWRITIGKNCYISNGVYLDGRGGDITIGDDVDISIDAILFTLTHNITTDNFSLIKGNIIVKDRVWVCARAIILPNSYIRIGAVIGANSVFRGETGPYQLLSGIPATLIKYLPKSRSKNVRG
jgi:acetyltransferase-like isoleucine patch superfamily enzyme